MQPKILILDDSTSSVDVETETTIQDALEQRMHDHTSFVVAQRISTVLNADKIIVIDKGRIVAQGTHKELMQTSPIYQEIYEFAAWGMVSTTKKRPPSWKRADPNELPTCRPDAGNLRVR